MIRTKKPKTNPKEIKIQHHNYNPLTQHYNISPQHAIFVAHYTKTWNEYDALKEAGLLPSPRTTRPTAKKLAHELINDPIINSVIQQAIDYRTQRILMSQDQIASHLAKIAYVDVGDAFDLNGNIKTIKDMPRNLRYAISKIKTKTLYAGKGFDRQEIGYITEIELESKLSALKELNNILNPKVPDIVNNNTINNNLDLSHLDIKDTNKLLELLQGKKEDESQDIMELEKIEKCNLQH